VTKSQLCFTWENALSTGPSVIFDLFPRPPGKHAEWRGLFSRHRMTAGRVPCSQTSRTRSGLSAGSHVVGFTTFFGFWLLLGFLSFILAAILHFFQNCSDSLCSVQDFSDSGIFSVSEWEFTVLKSAQERAQYPVLSLPAARDPSDVITSQACGRRRSASSVAELVRQWLQQAASAIISSLQDLRRLDCFCNSRCIRSLEQPFAAVDCTMSYICTLLQCPVLSLLLIIP